MYDYTKGCLPSAEPYGWCSLTNKSRNESDITVSSAGAQAPSDLRTILDKKVTQITNFHDANEKVCIMMAVQQL